MDTTKRRVRAVVAIVTLAAAAVLVQVAAAAPPQQPSLAFRSSPPIAQGAIFACWGFPSI